MSDAPATPPLDENATRAKHLAAIRGSRTFGLATGVTAAVALVFGAVFAGLPGAIGAPVTVVLLALIIAFVLADRRAHGDFWTGLAASMDMTFHGEVEVPATTPLLAAGDRRSCPEWMTGKLADGRLLAVGNYTFQIHHENGDQPDTWEDFDYTVALIDLAAPERAFVRGLYLRPRNRLRLFGERTLPGTRKERMHTESQAFEERYDLYVDPDDDQARVLEILEPAFIDQLSRNPSEVCFDYRAGTLAVFVEGHSTDAGRLVALTDAARAVAHRIDAEIAEATAANGADGARPR